MSIPAERAEEGTWVPVDTFGARLALVRQSLGGWNIRRTALYCGLKPETWRTWEAGKHPRNYEDVTSRIARATDCDVDWLRAGGPLVRNPCSSPLSAVSGADVVQPHLPFREWRAPLKAV